MREMLAYLRGVPSRTARAWSVSYHRSISSSRVVRAQAEEDEVEEEYAEDFEDDEGLDEDETDADGNPIANREADSDKPYEDWLQEDAVRYKDPVQPRNWLGGRPHPFPLNPSFQPPAPLSDKLRSRFYEEYMEDPNANSVRELSSRYGLSIKRVDAILRLKGLEAHWEKEGKTLQTGFLTGMEKVLGVPQLPANVEAAIQARHDVSEADALDEIEGEGVDREKYQRMFWEDVAEGEEAILPAALEQAKTDAANARKAAIDAKSDPVLLGIPKHLWRRRLKHTEPEELQPERKARMLRDRYEALFYEPSVHRDDLVRLERERAGEDPWSFTSQRNAFVVRSGASPARPHIKFEDVGGKFLDVKDRVRRMKESERRAKIKGRKRAVVQETIKAARVAA
ncbi:hypothetical protein GLOTRDRAFT_52353, partial [Gloeophyllum trabeum ATCC 11539]